MPFTTELIAYQSCVDGFPAPLLFYKLQDSIRNLNKTNW